MKPTCMRNALLSLGLAIGGLFAGSNPAYAQTIYKSADPSIQNGGWSLGGGQGLGGRFTLNDTYHITYLLLNAGGSGSLFVAINPIADQSSFPTADLSGDAFHTLYNVTGSLPTTVLDINTNFTLGPGTYAITTGSNLFGATGFGYMAQVAPLPGAALFVAAGTGSYTYFDTPSIGWSFEVDGTRGIPAVTPEGSSLAMLGLGLLPLGYGLKRKLKQA